MKKLLALLLTFAFVLSLAACATTTPPVTEQDPPAVDDTPAADEPAVDEPTIDEPAIDEPASSDEPPVVDTPAVDAPADGETIGQTLLKDFQDRANADSALTAQELADALLTNSVIQFGGASMPVEPGFLSGFDVEISGFQTGVMFGPVVGSIPFVGYVFTLEDGADVDAFKTTLETNANPRWLVCAQADETVIDSVGNTVFFLMCRASMEE